MKTEPSADIREAANAMWQTYVALLDEGFSEEQAMFFVTEMAKGAR